MLRNPLSRIFLCLMVLLGTKAWAQEVYSIDPSQGDPFPTQVTFSQLQVNGVWKDRVTRTYSFGTQSLDYAATGAFKYALTWSARPSSGTGFVQWLSFSFKSNGEFSASPCSTHFIVAGRWEGNTSRYDRGRGIIIGDGAAGESNYPAGNPNDTSCWTTTAGHAGVQGEVFYDPATSVGHAGHKMMTKFANVLVDNQEYTVGMQIADDGYSYTITDPATGAVVASQYEYVPNDGSVDWLINQGGGAYGSAQGIAFAAVFLPTNKAFSYDIKNIQFGWFKP